MCRRRARGPHLAQFNCNTSPCALPGRFRSRQSGADNPNRFAHCALREAFWEDVTVSGGGHELNQELERAGRVADFLELGELMCIDALNRRESCGGHFREESQTPDGEAARDDDNFSYVSAWEWTGERTKPVLHAEALVFDYVHPTQRSYA